MKIGYDIDGVITKGIIPKNESDVIITGRSFQEKNETLNYLQSLGIFNQVYFSPVKTSEKNYKTSGNHKANIINQFGIELFHEDEQLQADIILSKTPCKVIMIEKSNSNLLTDAINVQKGYYSGKITPSKIDSEFTYFVYNHPDAPIFLPKDDYEIVVLMSGGIDSFVAYHFAKSKYSKVKALYIDYGYPYSHVEKEAILRLNLGDLQPFEDHSYLSGIQKEGEALWGEIFPGRNWILSIIASEYIKNRGEIWMSAIGGEVKKLWGDKSEYFFENSSKILSTQLNKNIRVTTPFKEVTKGELVRWYVENGYDVEKLKQTVSCHYLTTLNDLPCGNCMGCAHRYVGMNYNGIHENYANNVKLFCEKIYRKELENPMSEFSSQRKLEINKAINE